MTAEGYTEFIATMSERAAAKAAALERRVRYGCCDHRGRNQLVVGVDTYGERGQLLSSVVQIKCCLDGRLCPSGQLHLLVELYRVLNGKRKGRTEYGDGGR